ncbi:hypothetical protein EVAR_97446_1 [Eumeta japonica]|uniref:Uncharacterized protein n=1 Tax=Eumeta variegata TaxID=151549 RepID=A0A4C1X144_EUMVA|nr:hypothetical protein EVAR_97446_1 [Eumeta japonica]
MMYEGARARAIRQRAAASPYLSGALPAFSQDKALSPSDYRPPTVMPGAFSRDRNEFSCVSKTVARIVRRTLCVVFPVNWARNQSVDIEGRRSDKAAGNIMHSTSAHERRGLMYRLIVYPIQWRRRRIFDTNSQYRPQKGRLSVGRAPPEGAARAAHPSSAGAPS